MRSLNIESTSRVLIPTGERKHPFVIVVQDNNGKDQYWLVREDGTLTGDGFRKEDLPKYLPNLVL